jgi:tRNA pseudouridine55 synthase
MSTLTIPDEKDIKNALKQFEGVVTQVPPAFSAIKINGQRAYKLAREGKEVKMPSRQVTINRIELVEYNYPYLKCVCDVSSGTYIRTLVEDIGKTLNIGAYCIQLRRTQVGSFQIKDSQTIEVAV